MNIILSSYSFGVRRGSEAGVGWNIALELARRGHQIWVLTTTEFHQDNVQALKQEGNIQLHLIEQDYGISQHARARSYKHWQKNIGQQIRQLCQQQEIDIIHHLTFNQYRNLHDIFAHPTPYLCGPIGGAEAIPLRLLLSLWKDLSLADLSKELLRQLPWDALALAWRARKSAVKGLYIASSPQTQKRLQETGKMGPIQLQSIIAIHEAEICEEPDSDSEEAPKPYSIYCGGLRAEKGPSLLLAAFSKQWQQQQTHKLCIVGISESEKATLNKQLKQHQIPKEAVIIHNYVSREKLQQLIKKASFFLCLNLRDSGCMALLEALSLGTPAICLDNPEQYWLPEEFASKIARTGQSKKKLVNQLAQHMIEKAKAPKACKQWHQRRSQWLRENMSWSKRVDYIEQQYKKLAQASR